MRDRLPLRTNPANLVNRTKAVSEGVHRLQKEMETATSDQLPDILRRTLEQMQTMADSIDILVLKAARDR